MPELNLPACPLCRAPGALSLQTRTVQAQSFTWYECSACGSVLLAVGDDRWAYQKVGVAGHAALLKRPLTAAELWGLLAPANVRTTERPSAPTFQRSNVPTPPPAEAGPQTSERPSVPTPAQEAAATQVSERSNLPTFDRSSLLTTQPANAPTRPGVPRLFVAVAAVLVLILILGLVALGAGRLLGDRAGTTADPTATPLPAGSASPAALQSMAALSSAPLPGLHDRTSGPAALRRENQDRLTDDGPLTPAHF